MARVRVPRQAGLIRFFLHPLGKALLLLTLTIGLAGLGIFTYYYAKYSRLIDQKFRSGPFVATSQIFAAPGSVYVGERTTTAEIAERLRRSGYREDKNNRLGWYHIRPDAIEIFPGRDAYLDQEAGVIQVEDGKVVRIVSTQDNTERTQFQLEPELITNLSDKNREKRRLVRFEDIPQVLVNAVVSAEDKRFFSHSGIDPIGILRAAMVDIRERRKDQGASTLSQQLARMFWLDQGKRWTRKAAEAVITLQLEQRLSKQEIFECYANQIPLGRRGTFNIHGFGEASQAYFGKDLQELTLPEAATLAGLIQRPSAYNPYRNPERMTDRRNHVLKLMRENGYIDDTKYAQAVAAPLTVASGAMESTEAPYFVDLVNDELQDRFRNHDFRAGSYRIYTTLDMDLQRAASDAIRIGMQSVDEQLRKQRRHRNKKFPEAQVALIAIDPRSGDVKALVGGRNYGLSQLNRIVARRQPGSIFKPFVYAAAMNSALRRSPGQVFTPITTVIDEPTTFWNGSDKPYEPGNFQDKYFGQVTLRTALSKSLNIPTVKIAESVGYESIVELATQAGMNLKIQPTPAVALGAYDVTPVEMAGAYTIFANDGVYVRPNSISRVRAGNGAILYQNRPEMRRVLDPRVAYIMVNLLEDVVRRGTAAGVRSRGFALPAAGKTGTSNDSRDGWFAGFTSELICVVWVGFDDNRELNLEGARSALPIWTEFMKRAAEHRAYRNAKPFEPPPGIVSVPIDPLSGRAATPGCPATRAEVFVAGTQPLESCPLHRGSSPASFVAGWDTGVAPIKNEEDGAVARGVVPGLGSPPELTAKGDVAGTDATVAVNPPTPPAPPQKKKSLFRRFLGVFK
ncbi:MAG: PBP1A family penicillin-binding protein [Bryobacteraceae bacterium]